MLLGLLLYSIFYYNVFIFGFKTCFFPFFRFIDLRVLRLLGKKIIFVFHGSDSRPPFIDGVILSSRKSRNCELLARTTRSQKRDIKMVERYADVLVDHPLAAHFHEREFVKYLSIGIPSPPNGRLLERMDAEGKVRILHCPSDINAKGTVEIRKAVAFLKRKGYMVDYVEISGKPNAIVHEALRACDFVVDQVYSDTPMPTFVAEAAIYGRPAVVSGYCGNLIKGFLGTDVIPPSHFCRPEELEDAIETLIVNGDYRRELGEKAYNFVVSKWGPNVVAERFLKLIANDISDVWLYNPRDIRYLNGACISEEKCRKAVKSLIEFGGVASLQLRDKPELERLFIDFAYS